MKTRQAPLPAEVTPAKRGRPRDERTRQAILQAADELLREGGLPSVTMEAVAERAKVGKPTVYRWFADRHAVAMAALMYGDVAEQATPNKRSKLGLLLAQLRAIAARFRTPTGRQVASIIAAADQDTELTKAFRNHFILARREEGMALLEAARAAGEVPMDLDVAVAADMLYGAVFFRLLMGHEPLSDAFIERIVAAQRIKT
jgi:AcrR family transcriptional regulator